MAYTIGKQTAQQIVETVKDVCGFDVNFINREGRIFASTDSSRKDSYHEIGRQVFLTGQPIEVETDDSFLGTHKGVNLPVRHRGEIAAVIGISGPPDEVRKYARLAHKITGMILWEHDAGVRLRNDENERNYIMRSLIFGESVNLEFMLELLKPLHLDTEAPYRTILIRTPLHSDESDNVRQAIRQTGSGLFLFQLPNEHILILEDRKYRYWAYLFRQLAERHPLQIGIGLAEGLFRQSLSYHSAKLAIQSLLSDQKLALYDELDLELLLASTSTETRQRFLEKTIRPLNEKERMIIDTYFSLDMSLKQTGETLFLHKNTLQYQLDKIARITGYDPRIFREAVLLYLALRLERFDS